ncbi:MAG: sodium:solute symporter [Alistipes sp.]|nr:sodium:solute symporter [Alistipes sp.]
MTPGAVLLTVLGYIAVLFVVAGIAGRRVSNRAFFTGNRENPWYVAALAMVGAAMSGVTFVSVPGSVAADSFSYMQMVFGFTAGQLVIAFVLIPLFYRLQVVSLYEYLDRRFGVTSHRTGAWFFFVSKMLAAALKIFAVCTVLQALVFGPFGLPFAVNAGAMVFLVWLYTRRGGVRSVVWTDILHTLCLVAAIVLSIVFLMRGLGIALPEIGERVASDSMSRVFFFDDAASPRYFWKMFFGGLFTLVAMTGLDQDMMQRNLSCRSARDAQINIVITAFSQMVVILLFLVLGVLLYLYAGQCRIPLPEKSDQLFAVVAVRGGLPLIVGIMFVVGLISSTYSSAGAALTALTTSFTVDMLRGPSRWDDRRLTRVRQWVHVAMAAVLAVVVLLFGRFGNDSVINLIFKVAGYTYGPILGMFAFGILTRRRVRDAWVPWIAVAAPLLSIALQRWAAERFGYHIGFELIAYNALFTMIGMACASTPGGKMSEDSVNS